MKLTSRIAALKKRKTSQSGAGEPTAARRRRPRWVWIGLGLLLVGGATFAVFDYFVWRKVPAALIGTWDVKSGSLAEGTLQFSPDGTLRMRHKTADVVWQVRVRGQTLEMTTPSANTGVDRTQRAVIQEVTPSSLVLQLDKGEVLRMVRRE
jgi:hypothetical protein